VKPRPETTPANKPFNDTRGSQRLAGDFFTSGDDRANRDIAARVTGDFVGTTDEIIQWAACKWGLDEDIVRAQAAVESKWQQLNLGDWHQNPKRCPPGHTPGVDGRRGKCPESWGLMQVKYRFYRSAWPDSARSTAFNLDTAYAVWRACYEGYEWWLNDVQRGKDYAAGDVWGCIGRWYSGRWHTALAIKYIKRVQRNLATRLWEQASFQKP
jgi:autotransporter family porin